MIQYDNAIIVHAMHKKGTLNNFDSTYKDSEPYFLGEVIIFQTSNKGGTFHFLLSFFSVNIAVVGMHNT